MKNRYLAVDGHAENWEEAITACGAVLKSEGCIGDDFSKACIEREKEFPTGLPSEIPIAIPHSKTDDIYCNAVCLLRLDEPVSFFRMDCEDSPIETNLVMNLAIKGNDDHVIFLQRLIGIVTDTEKMKTCLDMDINLIPAYLKTLIEAE